MTDTPDIPDIPDYHTVNTTDNTVVATYDGSNIEELIGFVQEMYPCSYSGVNGTLYAGTDGLAFLGKFFLFDKKMFLKWVDVKVQQTDQGVAIQTRDDNPVIHEFMGIQKPERVWSALVSLHNQALLDRPAETKTDGRTTTTRARAQTAVPVQRRQLRRMTSDPSKLAPAIEALFADGHGGNKAVLVDSSNVHAWEKQTVANDLKSAARRASTLLQVKPAGDDSKDSSASKSTKTNLVLEVNQMSEIEAIVGKIMGEFRCLYNGQPGTLHSGSTALYFAGERLFFPARLTIQSSHIRQVKMIKGKPKTDVPEEETQQDVIREQGIEICTHEGLSHTFLGMESPDQVWASLVALRNHVSAGPNSQRPFGMRRMNSDPNLQSKAGLQLLSTQAVGHASKEGAGASAEKELAPPVLSQEELQKAWSAVIDKKNRYTTCVVKDYECACTLDKFFKLYVADDAEHNIGAFMKDKMGDKDIKISPWKPSEQGGKLVRKRVVRYIHPVNAPMAPPEASARKEQTYQRFGEHGFEVDTHTFVVGVPMADCFFVKDRTIVAQGPGKGKVLLTMEFELEFVKSTMFKGIITKTTNSEVSKFMERRRDYMAEFLGEAVAPQKEEEHVEKKKEVAVEEPVPLPGLPYGLTMTSITHILLAFVIFMQFWILLEMRGMKRAVYRIEHAEPPVCYSSSEQGYSSSAQG